MFSCLYGKWKCYGNFHPKTKLIAEEISKCVKNRNFNSHINQHWTVIVLVYWWVFSNGYRRTNHILIISVWTNTFETAKEKSAWHMLFYHSDWNITASYFLLTACLKWHEFLPMSLTMLYSKFCILTEQIVCDIKFIPFDRRKLDLSKDLYLWYRNFYICSDTNPFYVHKECRSYLMK